MAKSLFIYIYFGLTTQKGVWESVTSQSHDECGKVVHRPCSSCISSVENLIGTPSSSPYQLRLRVDLSCLG